MLRSIILKMLLVVILLVSRMTGYAWVFFEHRDIGILAIRNLSDNDRALLSKFWEEARVGYEGRLSENPVDTSQFLHHTQLDFASWFAISGDHSCSPDDLLNNVLHTDWIVAGSGYFRPAKNGNRKGQDQQSACQLPSPV